MRKLKYILSKEVLNKIFMNFANIALLTKNGYENYSFCLSVIFVTFIVSFILVAIFAKKTKCGGRSFLYSITKCSIATILLETIIYYTGSFFGFFVVACRGGLTCPTKFDIFWATVPYTAVAIFSILISFCFLVKFLNNL